MTDTSETDRLKRRERELQAELDKRTLTPSQRQAAQLGYPPKRADDIDDDGPVSASEVQAAAMRRKVVVLGNDDE